MLKRLEVIADDLDSAAGPVETRSEEDISEQYVPEGHYVVEDADGEIFVKKPISSHPVDLRSEGKAINCKMYCGSCGAQQSSINVKVCESCGKYIDLQILDAAAPFSQPRG